LKLIIFIQDLYLSASVTSGMGSNQSISQVAGFCPTTECSWPSYTSLGVCADTEDITSTIMAYPNTADGYKNMSVADLTSNPVYPDIFIAGWPQQNLSRADFWIDTVKMIPSGQYLSGWQGGRPWNTIAVTYVIYFPSCAAWNNTRQESLTHVTSEQYAAFNAALNNTSNWKAFRGTFSLCVQDLVSNVSNGILTTEVVKTWEDVDWKIVGNTSDQSVVGRHAGRDYYMTIPSMWSAGLRIRQIFAGRATLNIAAFGEVDFSNEWTVTISSDIYGVDPVNCDPSPSLGFSGFQRRFQNVATALTNR
jgi:hypothetical protein